MRLISLKLSNFQGIKEFCITPNGENISIFGDNGTGKTTLFNAFSWLLFGKDSLGQANFEIKALDQNGEPAHGLEHSIKAVLLNGLDQKVELCKVYSEKWTKKRGSAVSEFTGHTVDHYIDGVPVKAGEFNSTINQMCPEKLFRLLTNPKYFNEQLSWQERRQVLLDVCGNISDEQIISGDSALSELPSILGKRTADDHRKVLTGRRAELNREIQELPVRISEAQKGIVEVNIPDIKQHRSRLIALQEELKQKRSEKIRIEQGGEVAEKRKRLAEIDEKLSRMRTQNEREMARMVASVSDKRDTVKRQITEIEKQIDSLLSDVRERVECIAKLDQHMIELRSKWQETFDSKFTSGPCQVCGALPENQPLLAESERHFNFYKSESLSTISSEGKKAKAERENLIKSNDLTKDRITLLYTGLETKKAELESITDPYVHEASPEWIALNDARTSIEKSINDLSIGINTGTLDTDIEAIEASIWVINQQTAQLEQNEKAAKRIEELKRHERELAGEYERTEKELYLIDLFMRRKAQALEANVADKFTLARFKLFNQQVNGGIDPVCVTTLDGVPYDSMNSAGRIQVGMDIIRTLQKHHGISCPLWIDNRESIVELPAMECQVISLVVSGKDKELRIG